MFAKFKTFLSRAGDTVAPSPARVAAPVGYFLPEKAATLLDTPRRRECLKKIQESSSLPTDVWQRLYLAPVNTLLERVQNVPATGEGIWAGAGGFGDLTLQFTSYAVRLAKGYMFPPGAAPEEQAEQGTAWQAIIFWEALLWHLPLLADIEGELENGVTWCPGISVPDRAYRFRFAEVPSDNYAQALASLIAGQLLPADAAPWICRLPGGMENLSVALWNKQTTMPVIGEILQRAAGLTESPGIPAPDNNNEVSIISNLTPDVDVLIVPATFENVIDSEISHESDESSGAETEALLALFGDVLPSFSNEEDSGAVNTETDKEPGINQGGQDVNFVEINNKDVSQNVSGNQKGERNTSLSAGEEFISWLSKNLVDGKVSINQIDSRVHIVAGFAFLCVPDIFWLFLRETGSNCSRDALQSSFEKLQLHRVHQGERFTKARLYETGERTGKYQKINGYLVKVVHIFKGITPPESGLLFFPN